MKKQFTIDKEAWNIIQKFRDIFKRRTGIRITNSGAVNRIIKDRFPKDYLVRCD